MLLDLFSLFLGSIPIHMAKDPGSFRLTVLLGMVLAGVCWYACRVFAYLWNKEFRLTLAHQFLCAFASICTVIFTIFFSSLHYTADAAFLSLSIWQAQINADGPWGERAFVKAYDQVKELGTEDFSGVPAPESPGSFIPTNQDDSRQTAALAFANEASAHFVQHRPFLSKVAWTNPGVPSEVIFEDVKTWHASDPRYPRSRAIEIAAMQIKQGLEAQMPRVISRSRIAVTLLFLVIQALPFGLIGWAAYRDIEARL